MFNAVFPANTLFQRALITAPRRTSFPVDGGSSEVNDGKKGANRGSISGFFELERGFWGFWGKTIGL